MKTKNKIPGRIETLVKPRIVIFWGQRRRITPRLVDRVFGDGKQIIGFTSIAQRPDYYVVRVDSSLDLTGHTDDRKRDIYEHTDEIITAIKDQFGVPGPRGGNRSFPVASFSCGSAWWPIEV